jgi:hypothetical protein
LRKIVRWSGYIDPGSTPLPRTFMRMVVGFTAGGPTDAIARIIAEKLSKSLSQQFYVDNRPGAGGNIASAEVAKAAPDGYTIIVVSTGFMVNMSLYAHVPYDAVKDFAPITMVAYSPNVLLVNPSMPAKSAKQIQFRRPRYRLNAASFGGIIQAEVRPGHGARSISRCRPGDFLCNCWSYADCLHGVATRAARD